MKKSQDEQFMTRCLELGKKGQPQPNPYCGSVLVSQQGEIVAQGYHKYAGQQHAEAACFKDFKRRYRKKSPFKPKELTLYVNLEPCCHYGSTPPCTDAIFEFGVGTVVYGVHDPISIVNGKGARILRKAGVSVRSGILEKECTKVNEQWIAFHKKKRPFIALRTATTLDGKIATQSGESKWITGERERIFTRALRTQYQAILVGINTVLKDNPHLGVRMRGKRDPIRIILDSELKIPLRATVLRDTNVIIATTKSAPIKKRNVLQDQGHTVWTCGSKKGHVSLFDLMGRMYNHNIISVCVEGGGTIISAFLNEGLADKMYWALAPKIMGDDAARPAIHSRSVRTMKDVLNLKDITYHQLGPDILVEGYLSAF